MNVFDWYRLENLLEMRVTIMRNDYDLSKAKRAKEVPHLKKLQAESKGKTRITIMLDNDVLETFRAQANSEGLGYQTLINRTLRSHSGTHSWDEKILRKIIREEVQKSMRDNS